MTPETSPLCMTFRMAPTIRTELSERVSEEELSEPEWQLNNPIKAQPMNRNGFNSGLINFTLMKIMGLRDCYATEYKYRIQTSRTDLPKVKTTLSLRRIPRSLQTVIYLTDIFRAINKNHECVTTLKHRRPARTQILSIPFDHDDKSRFRKM